MRPPLNGHLTSDHINGSWMATLDASEVGSGLASSLLAMPAFFLGWIAIGIGVAHGLARRGQARPLLLAPGFDHGGRLDVLALIQGHPKHVRSLLPTLDAAKSVLGTLTLARAVPYEWVEDQSDNEVIAQATSELLGARELIPIRSAALVVFPGTPEAVARRFSARSRPTLVLIAIDEATATSSNS